MKSTKIFNKPSLLLALGLLITLGYGNCGKFNTMDGFEQDLGFQESSFANGATIELIEDKSICEKVKYTSTASCTVEFSIENTLGTNFNKSYTYVEASCNGSSSRKVRENLDTSFGSTSEHKLNLQNCSSGTIMVVVGSTQRADGSIGGFRNIGRLDTNLQMSEVDAMSAQLELTGDSPRSNGTRDISFTVKNLGPWPFGGDSSRRTSTRLECDGGGVSGSVKDINTVVSVNQTITVNQSITCNGNELTIILYTQRKAGNVTIGEIEKEAFDLKAPLAPRVSITFTVSGSGKITGPNNLDCLNGPCTFSGNDGDEVDFSAIATANDYEFHEWSSAECGGNDSTPTITLRSGLSCQARFIQTTPPADNEYILKIRRLGTGGGNVNVVDVDPLGAGKDHRIMAGTNQQLIATANQNSDFKGWEGDAGCNLKSSRSINVLMDRAKLCKAKFDLAGGEVDPKDPPVENSGPYKVVIRLKGPGAAGATVRLTKGSLLQKRTTSSTGVAAFSSVPAGTWELKMTSSTGKVILMPNYPINQDKDQTFSF